MCKQAMLLAFVVVFKLLFSKVDGRVQGGHRVQEVRLTKLSRQKRGVAGLPMLSALFSVL